MSDGETIDQLELALCCALMQAADLRRELAERDDRDDRDRAFLLQTDRPQR